MDANATVVGSGLIASLFEPQRLPGNTLIFASGVSNSLETGETNFQREIDLLLKTAQSFPRHRMIYFSSIPIIRPETQRYFAHKKKVEEIIRGNVDRYVIFRLPSVVGQTNKTTLLNFLVRAIKEDRELNINRYARRRFIKAADIKQITHEAIEKNLYNCVLDLCSDSSIPVVDIVNEIASALKKKPKKLQFSATNELVTMDNTLTKNFLGKGHKLFERRYNHQCLEFFLLGLREWNK